MFPVSVPHSKRLNGFRGKLKRTQCKLTALGKIKNGNNYEKNYNKEQIREACSITELHIDVQDQLKKDQEKLVKFSQRQHLGDTSQVGNSGGH